MKLPVIASLDGVGRDFSFWMCRLAQAFWKPAMGGFDFPTYGWRRQRAEALENLRVLGGGPRCFRKGCDVTKFQIAKEMQTVAQMDILIADHEANRAHRQ